MTREHGPPARPDACRSYLATHPLARRSLPANLAVAAARARELRDGSRYFTVHAYRWIGGRRQLEVHALAAGSRRPASTASARARPAACGRDYLQEEIERAAEAAGTARWTLEAQIAGEGDDVDDPARRVAGRARAA